MVRAVFVFIVSLAAVSPVAHAQLQAGAAIVDVTPVKFPVLVNGGMTSRSASEVTTRINARAIVVADGNERIGIVVVDSCMMPRPLLDEAKKLAAAATHLKPDRILISATHTHTAPSCMGALGTDADSDYLPVLRAGIVEALQLAESHLEPAKVGWAVENAELYTALRRWIRRPDRLAVDPFGNMTVRANMHAGRNWDDVVGESGPEDPDLSLISFQSHDGRPIAVLANFSMHYFSGQKALAADYFGLFCDGLQEKLAHGQAGKPDVVAIMSHGCSGDIWRRDYTQPPEQQIAFEKIEDYTEGLLNIALKGLSGVTYKSDADLAMAETRFTLNYRVPNQQRLEWAQKIVDEMGDRLPKTQPEIYAREQILLHEKQSTEIVVQGIRIGDIGIATTPNETYALTGLKVKLQSPLNRTMVIELANGGDGYIPPPEQHLLGGYNTWAARSAGLEVQAEPKIAEAALQMLEQAANTPRKLHSQTQGPAAKAIADCSPLAWYRLDEFSGPWARDSSGHGINAVYEPAVAYFLKGPGTGKLTSNEEKNRCVHFAGNRLNCQLPQLADTYSVAMWVWNGMPTDARDVTGWMYSRGTDQGLSPASEHLGISGTSTTPGRLIYQTGATADAAVGTTELQRWTWNHVVLVRTDDRVQVYLNGSSTPEIDLSDVPSSRLLPSQVFVGGRCDNQSNWEGRIDEVAIFDRALSAEEITQLSGQ